MKLGVLIIILVAVVVITLIFQFNRPEITGQVIEEEGNTIFNIDKIQVEMTGTDKFDLFIGEKGGNHSQINYITVKNNNAQTICVEIYCESFLNRKSGKCLPTKDNPHSLCIESKGKQARQILISTERRTDRGAYSGAILTDLTKIIDTRGEEIHQNQTIKEFSLNLNVYERG